VLYIDWVDQVLVTLDRIATGDANAALMGVDVHRLQSELGVFSADHGYEAVATAVNDLELLSCAEADGYGVKLNTQGHRIARGGGLRAGWKSIFDKYRPLDEDRRVLSKAVGISLHESADLAWTERVEIKEALRSAGRSPDQGDAIALTKRLQSIGCLHSEALITMGGNAGMCEAHPTYVAVVVTTQQLTTEQQTLLDDLIEEWETTGVDVKETLELRSERQRAEFCKDVMALANTRVSGRRFMVVGFNDVSREFTQVHDFAVTSNQMESVLSAYCTPVPEIRLSTVPLGSGQAAIIEVLNKPDNLPYRLARDVWKFKADSVFVRHNTLVQQAVGEELARLIAEGERARRLR
jgi:hypothetical protein